MTPIGSVEHERSGHFARVAIGAFAALAAFAAGCSGGGSHGVNLGAPPASSGAPAAPSGPSAAGGIAWARGAAYIHPPTWFPAVDDAALAAAFDEYLADFAKTFPGWSPLPASKNRLPFRVILHDVPGADYWSASTRTAWLAWPKGPTPKPIRRAFAPLLHTVLMLERRRDLGIGGGVTADESAATARGRTLPIEIKSAIPAVYEP